MSEPSHPPEVPANSLAWAIMQAGFGHHYRLDTRLGRARAATDVHNVLASMWQPSAAMLAAIRPFCEGPEDEANVVRLWQTMISAAVAEMGQEPEAA